MQEAVIKGVAMAAFYDTEGREWLAEKIGRTSGIMSPKDKDPSALAPHDIVRLTCTVEGQQLVRETTVEAGTLDGLSSNGLLKLLDRARIIA